MIDEHGSGSPPGLSNPYAIEGDEDDRDTLPNLKAAPCWYASVPPHPTEPSKVSVASAVWGALICLVVGGLLGVILSLSGCAPEPKTPAAPVCNPNVYETRCL